MSAERDSGPGIGIGIGQEAGYSLGVTNAPPAVGARNAIPYRATPGSAPVVCTRIRHACHCRERDQLVREELRGRHIMTLVG